MRRALRFNWMENKVEQIINVIWINPPSLRSFDPFNFARHFWFPWNGMDWFGAHSGPIRSIFISIIASSNGFITECVIRRSRSCHCEWLEIGKRDARHTITARSVTPNSSKHQMKTSSGRSNKRTQRSFTFSSIRALSFRLGLQKMGFRSLRMEN